MLAVNSYTASTTAKLLCFFKRKKERGREEGREGFAIHAVQLLEFVYAFFRRNISRKKITRLKNFPFESHL